MKISLIRILFCLFSSVLIGCGGGPVPNSLPDKIKAAKIEPTQQNVRDVKMEVAPD
jgi:hypothetical protein